MVDWDRREMKRPLTKLGYCFIIFLEALRNDTKTCQGCSPPGTGLNMELPGTVMPTAMLGESFIH
jgi:hypothetical protein